MPSDRNALLAVAMLAVGLAAACSAPAPGMPSHRRLRRRQRRPRHSGRVPKRSAGRDGFPADLRPDPKEQRKTLGIEAVGSTPSKDNDGNDGCDFQHDSSKPNWGILIGPVPQHDASIWLAAGAGNAPSRLRSRSAISGGARYLPAATTSVRLRSVWRTGSTWT